MSRELPSSQSWFEDGSISEAVSSLQEQASRAAVPATGDTPKAKPDDNMRLVVGTIVVLGLMLIGVIAMATFGKKKPGEEGLTPFQAVRGLALVAIVLVGGGYATKYYMNVKTNRAGLREEAFHRIASRESGLLLGQRQSITGAPVGAVPWLVTEIDMLMHCNLHGRYKEHPLAVVECTCVLDMTQHKVEATMGKLAGKIMSHIEHEGVQRRCLEAIVFYDPLDSVPDLFLAPTDEPLHWYFNKNLQKAGPSLQQVKGKDYWLASTDADACARLITPELERALRSYPEVIVQVFSGYCTVISKSWSWVWPKDMPAEEQQIESHLQLACTIYDALNGNRPLPAGAAALAPAIRAAEMRTPVAAPEERIPEEAALPAAPPAPAAPRQYHRWIGASIGALLFGGLTLAVEAPHYPPEKQTPVHLIGQAIFPMMIGALLGLFIGHRIQRNTWRSLVAPGAGALLCTGILLGLSLPDKPAEQITFSLLMAYTLIAVIPGAAVGWLVGWVLGRRR